MSCGDGTDMTDLGGDNAELDMLYLMKIVASHDIYLIERYLPSDLIEAYDAVHKKKCRTKKGREK